MSDAESKKGALIPSKTVNESQRGHHRRCQDYNSAPIYRLVQEEIAGARRTAKQAKRGSHLTEIRISDQSEKRCDADTMSQGVNEVKQSFEKCN